MTTQDISDIKKAVEEKNVIVGTKRSLKLLKTGLLKVIYLAKNCPEGVKQDVTYYAELSNVKVIQLEQPNDELAALCRKSFSVALVGIKN